VSEPHFLTLESIHFLHRRSIARYGGTLGLRDEGGLESAALQPMNTYYYGGGDLFDIAAAYAFHIAEAQAFLDGNKRTAVAACFRFLEENGVTTLFDAVKMYDAMIAIAQRQLTKAELAASLRQQASGQSSGNEPAA
jgi:death on curing protein